MLINDVYVNENAIITMQFYEERKAGIYNPYDHGSPSHVKIYANCPEPIKIKCSREQFEQAVDSLHKYHLMKARKPWVRK